MLAIKPRVFGFNSHLQNIICLTLSKSFIFPYLHFVTHNIVMTIVLPHNKCDVLITVLDNILKMLTTIIIYVCQNKYYLAIKIMDRDVWQYVSKALK